jgi:maltose/moltooligosaccharide transporter
MASFPYRRTFLLGFGFFGISIIWPLFNSLIPPMLEDLGLSAVLIGFILTWDNIINMFVQPWVGTLSDRTTTRIGRRKPWLLVGAPIAALFFILVPFVRENLWLIAFAILGTNIGMAIFRSPTIAYLGDLFRPQERSQANGVINLMGGLGGAVALFGGGALYKLGVPYPFIAGALAMLLAILVVLLAVRERALAPPGSAGPQPSGLLSNLRQAAQGKNKSGLRLLGAIFAWFVGWNAMEAFFTIYARSVLGISVGSGTQMLTAFAAALILFAIPSGLIATRLGRRPIILTGLAGMILGLLAGFFIRSPTALLVTLALMGGCWALVNINSLPMVYDLSGPENIGAYTGLYYFASSAAAICGPILAGQFIEMSGPGVIWPFGAASMAVAALLMLGVHHQPVQQPA